MTITKITATELTKRDGSFKGYRYDAHLDDGTIEVARASATRLYENAFQYGWKANGAGKSGIAPYFCFGVKAPYQDRPGVTCGGETIRGPIATFKVELA